MLLLNQNDQIWAQIGSRLFSVAARLLLWLLSGRSSASVGDPASFCLLPRVHPSPYPWFVSVSVCKLVCQHQRAKLSDVCVCCLCVCEPEHACSCALFLWLFIISSRSVLAPSPPSFLASPVAVGTVARVGAALPLLLGLESVQPSAGRPDLYQLLLFLLHGFFISKSLLLFQTAASNTFCCSDSLGDFIKT